MVSIKIDPDALELAKLAASETGETVGDFASRVIKGAAAGVIEKLTPLNAAKKIERAKEIMRAGEDHDPLSESAPEPPPGPGPAPKARRRKGGENG